MDLDFKRVLNVGWGYISCLILTDKGFSGIDGGDYRLMGANGDRNRYEGWIALWTIYPTSEGLIRDLKKIKDKDKLIEAYEMMWRGLGANTFKDLTQGVQGFIKRELGICPPVHHYFTPTTSAESFLDMVKDGEI